MLDAVRRMQAMAGRQGGRRRAGPLSRSPGSSSPPRDDGQEAYFVFSSVFDLAQETSRQERDDLGGCWNTCPVGDAARFADRMYWLFARPGPRRAAGLRRAHRISAVPELVRRSSTVGVPSLPT